MLTLKFVYNQYEPISEKSSTGQFIIDVESFNITQWTGTEKSKFHIDPSSGSYSIGKIPTHCFIDSDEPVKCKSRFQYFYVEAWLASGKSVSIVACVPRIYVMNSIGKTIDTHELAEIQDD